MIYSKKFEDGSVCNICAPDDIPQEMISAITDSIWREKLKIEKTEKLIKWIFGIFGFCAAAVSAALVIRRKLKNTKV